MLQKMFSRYFERVCFHAGWTSGTQLEDGVVVGPLSQETDLSEVRTYLAPMLAPLHFFLWDYLKAEIRRKKNPATISPMEERVKEIIESIPAEILQHVIGEFSCRIRNCIVARGGLYGK